MENRSYLRYVVGWPARKGGSNLCILTNSAQTEKKRRRNAKKAARRKARKAKLADDKLISRLQPGLGLNNPYEKRKAREELAMARSRGKFSQGEKDSNNDYGTSGKFFKRMQEVVDSVRDGDDQPTPKRQRKGSKASSLKL